MNTLKAGVGSAFITPPVGIEMGIWSLRTGLAQGVHDDMCARALVLDDGRTPVAIVSVDVVGVADSLTQQIRDIVSAQVPALGGRILINASHSHTTPYTGRRLPAGLSAGHLAYLQAFPHFVAGAILEAWSHRQEATIGVASTDVPGITVNRRDPSLPVDPELNVIRVDSADGWPMACLVNYACHGTTVGAHHLDWTADFPGYLARTIEEAEPGCQCMFLQGAEGDIHPWDWYFGNPQPRFDDHYEGAERLGKAIAGPTLGLLQRIQTEPAARIGFVSNRILLPPRPIPWTAEQAEAYLADIEAMVPAYRGATIPDNCPGCMSAQRFPNNYRLSGVRHEAQFARDYPVGIEVELNALRIGDIVLATNSGELFSGLGMEIKRRSPFAHTLVLSVTNGTMGYIPIREAAEAVLDLPLEEFTDPVKHRRHYGATITTEVGPSAGEMVVEETLRLIAGSRV